MGDTSWWDSMILRVRWSDQGWEIRAGVFCIAFLAWLIFDLVQWLVRKDEAKPTPEQPSQADQPSP